MSLLFILLFLVHREETPLQMEISFVHVNFPYKRVTSTRFSVLLLCLLSQNNWLTMTLVPKRHIWGERLWSSVVGKVLAAADNREKAGHWVG